MAMNAVKIAEFKNRLSAYLRRVRRGEEILVTDRDTPIAKVSPATAPTEAVQIDAARLDPATLRTLRFRRLPGVDSLALLAEERGTR
jgi:prevent-host-death family protein